MNDIVAIGEILIDFTPEGRTSEGTSIFSMNPRGAPGNVLALLSKLGMKTALIAKVGDDQFGKFLKTEIEKVGIDTRNIIVTKDANTTMAFVHLDDTGNRSFSFCRKPGADTLLEVNEVDLNLIYSTQIFHFGTVSMTHKLSRMATLYALSKAKANGALISFDPNIRAALWDNLEDAKEMIQTGIEYADILKISSEELEFITDTDSLEYGSEIIEKEYGIPLILVTLGPKGCFYRIEMMTGIIPTYDVKTIDTTGAGDAFLGAFLFQFIKREKDIHDLTRLELEKMIDFANAAGSLVTTKKGAIPAMPSLQMIEECIRSTSKLL